MLNMLIVKGFYGLFVRPDRLRLFKPHPVLLSVRLSFPKSQPNSVTLLYAIVYTIHIVAFEFIFFYFPDLDFTIKQLQLSLAVEERQHAHNLCDKIQLRDSNITVDS